MKNVKKYFSLSICILSVLVLSTIGGVFAWFVIAGQNADSVIFYSGDIDLNVGVYTAIDANRDGILDLATDELGNTVFPNETVLDGVTYPRSSRGDISSFAYTEVSKSLLNTHAEVIAGTSIILRVIVENKDINTTSCKVSVSFSDLGSYFFRGEGMTLDERIELMNEYTARVMFKLQDIEARAYSVDQESENGLLQGYSTLVRSSVATECNDTVTQITTLNEYNTNTFYLWEISSRELFFSNITVNPGELLELDFRLMCMQTDEIFEQYSAYWQNYIDEGIASGTLTAQQAAFIDEMYNNELSYMLSEDEQSFVTELRFDINKIYVFGEQLPRGGSDG